MNKSATITQFIYFFLFLIANISVTKSDREERIRDS